LYGLSRGTLLKYMGKFVCEQSLAGSVVAVLAVREDDVLPHGVGPGPDR
jgi:hypothetical protein